MSFCKLNKLMLISLTLVSHSLLNSKVDTITYINNEAKLKENLKNSTKPSLVEFHAEAWCGPCKFIGPKVEQISQQEKGINVIKINHDENEALAGKYKVRGFPTFMFFEAGSTEPMGGEFTFSGADEDKIKATIKKVLSTARPVVAEEKREEKKNEPVETEVKTVPSGKRTEITSKQHLDDLLDSGKAVLVEFSKDACTFCVEMDPTLDKLVVKHPDVTFVKVKKEITPELIKEHKITGYPTYKLYKGGKVQSTVMGNAHELLGRKLGYLTGAQKEYVPQTESKADMKAKAKSKKSQRACRA